MDEATELRARLEIAERERDEARARVDRLESIVSSARYCLVDIGSEVAARACLEGNGLEDGIAEDMKTDLDRARDTVAAMGGGALSELRMWFRARIDAPSSGILHVDRAVDAICESALVEIDRLFAPRASS